VEVASLAAGYESTIGRHECTLIDISRRAPLSVILGLGTMGLGVYQRIAALPGRFRVVGALVRDRATHVAVGLPMDLIHESIDALREPRPGIVVNALSGLQPSQSLVHYSSHIGLR
jgi:hypothetical protein